MKKHQVIGACVKTQTISWEDEMKLIEGAVYDINFGDAYVDGLPITELPVSALIDAIDILPDTCVDVATSNSSYEYNPNFWAEIDAQVKKERKKEEKWKRKHKKYKSQKKACKKLDRIVYEIMRY